jgi:CIC family chloride channel protein
MSTAEPRGKDRATMHELWIKYRLRVLNACRVSESHSMLLWGALAGFVGALATIAFRECIALLQIWLTGHDGSFVDIAKGLPWLCACCCRPAVA